MPDSVDEIIAERIGSKARPSARLALGWLRSNPQAIDAVREVFAAGARGNPDAFRAFAGILWGEIARTTEGFDGSGIAADDEDLWIGPLARVANAWAYHEQGQRGS